MNRQDQKMAAAKQQVQAAFAAHEMTPRIPGLPLKPRTGTAIVTPVPAILAVPITLPKVPIVMTAEQVAFLCLRTYPARLNLWQFATLLGMTEDQIRKLIKYEFLTPMNVGHGTDIYFAFLQVVAIRDSFEQIQHLTQALNGIWKEENHEKSAQA